MSATSFTVDELLSAEFVERLWSGLPLHTFCRCEPEWDDDNEVCAVNDQTCECDRRTIPCVRNALAGALGQPQIAYVDPIPNDPERTPDA